jgi:hypothetical protein
MIVFRKARLRDAFARVETRAARSCLDGLLAAGGTASREIGRLAGQVIICPEIHEEETWLIVQHVIVDGCHLDAACAQGAQHRIHLGGGENEIAGDRSLAVARGLEVDRFRRSRSDRHFQRRPALWAALTIAVELLGPLLILAGRWVWLAPACSACSTVLAAFTANAFWTMQGEARFMATNAFFEHLAWSAVSCCSPWPTANTGRAP